MTAPRPTTIPPQGRAAKAAALHRASVPVIDTERLRLRAPRIEDLPLWTARYTGPDAVYIGGTFDDPECVAWEEFAYYTGAWMLYGHGLWTAERRADEAAIGFVHLAVEWDDWEIELGWQLIPKARGQGYGAEMARAARAFGLEMLDTFVSYIDPENAPSNRLAERIGAHRDTAVEARIAAMEGDGVNVWRHGVAP